MKPLICVVLVTVLLLGCKVESKPTPAEPASESEARAAGDDEQGKGDEEQPAGPGGGKTPASALQAKTELLKKALADRQRNKTLGKMVNWRKLATFLPDAFGAFKASQKARGKNFKMDKLETASAKRYYRAGKKDLTVELNDLSVNPMLRASITVARKMKLDLPNGYMEYGLKVGGNPADRAWGIGKDKKSGTGMLKVLVGGRYLVQFKLVGAANADEVIQVYEKLDLARLPALRAD